MDEAGTTTVTRQSSPQSSYGTSAQEPSLLLSVADLTIELSAAAYEKSAS